MHPELSYYRKVMLQEESELQRKGIKVIHVHFIHGRKNYYFGSVRAVFKRFSPEEVGCTEDHLRRMLSHDGDKYFDDNVLVVRSRLIR